MKNVKQEHTYSNIAMAVRKQDALNVVSIGISQIGTTTSTVFLRSTVMRVKVLTAHGHKTT